MAHTPGPWTFYELPDSKRDGLGYIRTVPEDGLEIAHHGDMGRSWSENVANGHLIAAAPDLLAVCQSIAGGLAQIGDVENFIRVIDAARAAIARATGS